MPARITRHGLTRIVEAMEMNPAYNLVPAETAAQTPHAGYPI